jgi:hypothetical protein
VEEALLELDLEGSPLNGKPLPRRLRNFRPAVDRYVASLGGPLPYMLRLREVELETEAHERRLDEARHELAAECACDATQFERRWRAAAARWSFSAVNDLIDRHTAGTRRRRGCRWIRAAATSCWSAASRTGSSRSTPAGFSSASRPSSSRFSESCGRGELRRRPLAEVPRWGHTRAGDTEPGWRNDAQCDA